MKKAYILIIIFCLLSFTNDSGNSFYIAFKQKIVVEVTQKNATEFEFTPIKKEPFNKIIDPWDNDDVISKSGKKETIEFYLFQAQEEGSESTILLVKNRSKFSFQFDTEIQNSENSKFKLVPNGGTHTNSKTQETWEWKINQIRISNFRLKK